MIVDEGKDRFLNECKNLNDSLMLHYIRGCRYYTREYYKVYFQNTPYARSREWNFPFLDIYVFFENETLVWKMGYPDDCLDVNFYYPLAMRPLGELWLPTARYSRKLFGPEYFDECKTHDYDHRKEKTKVPSCLSTPK